jgi:hypothetical protein
MLQKTMGFFLISALRDENGMNNKKKNQKLVPLKFIYSEKATKFYEIST